MFTSIPGPPLSIKFCSVKKTVVLKPMQEHDSKAVGVYLVTTQSNAKKNSCWSCSDRTFTLAKEFPRRRTRKQAVCACNRKTKERSWACCAGKFHGPDIRALHSKNSGKRAYHPTRDMQSL